MEQSSKYYDDVYAQGSYDKDPADLPWYPLWRAIVDYIKDKDIKRVIDLGCGPGNLAEMLHNETEGLSYSGWDFSEKAIEKAREKCPHIGYAFAVGDLGHLDFKEESDYFNTVFICSEVLEHIEDDLGLFKRLPHGSTVLLTVPDFDDPGHVRHFDGTWGVVDRYRKVLDIEEVSRLDTGHHFLVIGNVDFLTPATRLPGITLLMQVRDEEVGIGRAIRSVQSVASNTLVSVDDATTDETQIIADGLGALTYKMKWKRHFSEARNELNRRCETEWALVLDGHEYVKFPEKLKEAIEKYPDAAAIECLVEMEDGHRHTHYRLYKPHMLEWKNPEHNIPVPKGKAEKFHELVVIHDRHGGQSMESRARRAVQRDDHLTTGLSTKIAEDPKDTRSMYYLGQQHRDSSRWLPAYYWYDRYCRTQGGNQWVEELFQAHVNAARAALPLTDFEGAMHHAKRATDIMSKRGEGWAVLGDSYYRQENYEEAYRSYVKADQCPVPIDARLPVSKHLHDGGYMLLDAMSMCCWRMAKYDEGVELCKKLLAHPKLPEKIRSRIEKNLIWHKAKLGGRP